MSCFLDPIVPSRRIKSFIIMQAKGDDFKGFDDRPITKCKWGLCHKKCQTEKGTSAKRGVRSNGTNPAGYGPGVVLTVGGCCC